MARGGRATLTVFRVCGSQSKLTNVLLCNLLSPAAALAFWTAGDVPTHCVHLYLPR